MKVTSICPLYIRITSRLRQATKQDERNYDFFMITMIMQFIATQAFLTLVSLPILTAWGLPTSWWSPLGNLLFSPILSVYLFCAVLVFFSEMLCIPNMPLIWILDTISNLWLWCMSLLPSHATIGFARPHACLLIGILIAAFFVAWVLRRASYALRALVLILILCCTSVMLKYTTTAPNGIYTIEQEAMHITCAHSQGAIALIAQDSCLARKPSPESWFAYQMMSEIVAQTGAVAIDHFVLLHPRQRLFDALTALCQQVTIKNIYLPLWEGLLNPKTWRAYARMKRVIQEHGGKVHILKDCTTVNMSSDMKLTFTKTDKKHAYQDAQYSGYTFDQSRNTGDALPR